MYRFLYCEVNPGYIGIFFSFTPFNHLPLFLILLLLISISAPLHSRPQHTHLPPPTPQYWGVGS